MNHQALYARLYAARKAGKIPPVWVDEDVIRVMVEGELMAIGHVQAQKMLAEPKPQRRKPRRHIGWQRRRAVYLRGKRFAASL